MKKKKNYNHIILVKFYKYINNIHNIILNYFKSKKVFQ
jgi:hypothetical protein